MALELLLNKDSVNADGSTMTIKDITGLYDVALNPGGYGTPNAARNTLALFLVAYNKRFDGLEDITDNLLPIFPYDPLTVDTWVLTMFKQGWVNVNVYGLQIYDVNTSYLINECVYDPTYQNINRILTRTGTGPYVYTSEVVLPAALGDGVSITAYAGLLDTYIIGGLCLCLQKARKLYFDKLTDAAMMPVRQVLAYIDSINVSFQSDAPADGQKKVEAAESICNCITEDCNC